MIRLSSNVANSVQVGAILVTLLVAGCSADPDAPNRSTEPGERLRIPHETAHPSTPIEVDTWLDTAEAHDARQSSLLGSTTRVVLPRTGAVYYVGLAVSGDGRLLASRNSVSASGDESLGTPHLGWLSQSGFEPLPYDDANSASRQVTFAEVDGDTVTWVETSSTDLFRFDWQVYTATAGRVGRHLCADSADLFGGKPLRPVFGGTRPTVVGTSVFWTGTTPGEEPTDSHVFVCRAGETAGIAVDRAALVTGDRKDIYYVRRPRAVAPKLGSTQIVRRRVAGGKESVVVDVPGPDGEVTALDAAGSHLAWVVSTSDESAELFVKDLDAGSVIGVQLHQPGTETMFLNVGTDAVVWGNGSSGGDAGQYLLALEDEELWRLGEAPGYSVAYANEQSIAWSKLVAKEGAPPIPVFETAMLRPRRRSTTN